MFFLLSINSQVNSALGSQFSQKCPTHTEVLLDNSGSTNLYQKEAINRLTELVLQWFATAQPGDRITIWVFEPKRSPRVVRILYRYDFPRLKPPAYRHRRKLAEEETMKIKSHLESLPQVDQSPILEAIARIWERKTNRKWRLIIISDLIQSSSIFSLSQNYLRTEDEKILQHMLKITGTLPRSAAPERAVILWYPGLVDGKEIDRRLHVRIRELFMKFFSRYKVMAKFEALI